MTDPAREHWQSVLVQVEKRVYREALDKAIAVLPHENRCRLWAEGACDCLRSHGVTALTHLKETT